MGKKRSLFFEGLRSVEQDTQVGVLEARTHGERGGPYDAHRRIKLIAR